MSAVLEYCSTEHVCPDEVGTTGLVNSNRRRRRPMRCSVVDRIKGGAYSDEQFRALSPDDKRRVQKYRDEAKKKKRSKNKDRKEKRKLAKLKAEKDNASEDEGEDEGDKAASSSAGAQFGANGNKHKKSKS